MTYQTDEARVRHEANLRREEIIWEAYNGRMVHSDRAAVDLGIGALRAAVLVNAGSIVAVLAFVAEIWKVDRKRIIINQIVDATELFVYGLTCGIFAFLIAYFYQSAVTASYYPELSEIPLAKKTISKKHDCFIKIVRVVMVILGVIALVLFICGSVTILNIFANSPLPAKI